MSKLIHALKILKHYLPWLPKTIFFNFHYLPFRQAIKLPILLQKPHFIKLKGRVIIQSDKISFGMVQMGTLVNTCNPNNGITFDIDGTLIFKGSAIFANDSYIMIRDNGTITIGTRFDGNCKLKCAKSIEIGNDTVIAYDSMVMDSDWHALTDMVTGKLVHKTAPVKIGNYNFISYKCIVTKGTITPDYATFTFGSLLNKKFEGEKYSLFGGNPCQLLDEGYFMDPKNN